MMFILVAYALSAGNAGTGFRYRTHLVTLGIAMMAILREVAASRKAERREVQLAEEGRRREVPGQGEPRPSGREPLPSPL
jgi:hypothetical protein